MLGESFQNKSVEFLKLVASWFISPILSGIVSMLMFMLIRRLILRAENPLASGLKFLPIIYTLTITINMGGIVESAPPRMISFSTLKNFCTSIRFFAN